MCVSGVCATVQGAFVSDGCLSCPSKEPVGYEGSADSLALNR